MELVPPAVELSENAVRALAVAMRDVVAADGPEQHPREVALIAQLTDGAEVDDGPADLGAIEGPLQAEVFLKSLVLAALADGEVSAGEGEVILDYAGKLGLGEREVARCTTDVASAMLSQLQGVTHFRDQVIAIGERMGLDRFSILHALDSGAD